MVSCLPVNNSVVNNSVVKLGSQYKYTMNMHGMLIVFLSAWLPLIWSCNADDFFLAYYSCYNMAPDCPHVVDLRNVTLDDCMAQTNKRLGNVFTYKPKLGQCSILVCPLDDNLYYKQLKMEKASGMNIWLKRHATKYNELQPERPQSENGILDYTNQAVDLLSRVLGMSIQKPYVGRLVGAMIKTIINIFTEGSYDSIQAQVLWDITEKIEENDINKMKIKLGIISEKIQKMQDIVGATGDLHDWNTGNNSVETDYDESALLEEVRTLEQILDTSRDDFTLMKNQYKSLAFYKNYALSHIFTLAILEKADDPSLQYKQRMESATHQHLQYMMAGIGQLHQLKTQSLIKLYKSSCLKFKDDKAKSEAFGVNRLMDCSLKELFHTFAVDSLRGFLPDSSIDDTILKSGERIALKFGNVKHDLWFNCGGSGSNCRLTKIDKKDQPFGSTDSCNRIEFENRGLMFWIHALERSLNEAVRTCDKVSLFYSTEVTKYYYVSGKYKDMCITIPHCAIQTKTCPGDAFQSGNITKIKAEMDDCPNEQFEIHVPGYACGVEIRDRTAVVLRSSSSNHIIIPEAWRVGSPEEGWELKLLSPGDCDYKSSWVIYKMRSPFYEYWSSQEEPCYKQLQFETSRAERVYVGLISIIAGVCLGFLQLAVL